MNLTPVDTRNFFTLAFSTMEVRIKPSFLFSIPTNGNPTSTGSRPMPSQSSSMPVLVPSSQASNNGSYYWYWSISWCSHWVPCTSTNNGSYYWYWYKGPNGCTN